MLWAQPAYMPAVTHRPEVTLTSNRAELWGFSLLHTSQSLKLVGWMNYVSRLSDSETVWPRPWLAAPAISHEPNKNVFSIGGAARLCCLKKEKKKKRKGGGGGHPSSTLTALPNPIFFLLLPLTHLLPVATCQHTRTHKTTQWTMWKRAGGFRKNKLPSLTFNETPPRHCCDRGERKKKRRRNEQKVRWKYQTRRNTYHWFHCWSPRLPLSKCRTSEEDKTRHTGSVSGEEEFLHHKQNDSVANLLKDFMISSVNYVTVVPLWVFLLTMQTNS